MRISWLIIRYHNFCVSYSMTNWTINNCSVNSRIWQAKILLSQQMSINELFNSLLLILSSCYHLHYQQKSRDTNFGAKNKDKFCPLANFANSFPVFQKITSEYCYNFNIICQTEPWSLVKFAQLFTCSIFQQKHKHVSTTSIIPLHWHDTGSWNPSSWKTRTYLVYIPSNI